MDWVNFLFFIPFMTFTFVTWPILLTLSQVQMECYWSKNAVNTEGKIVFPHISGCMWQNNFTFYKYTPEVLLIMRSRVPLVITSLYLCCYLCWLPPYHFAVNSANYLLIPLLLVRWLTGILNITYSSVILLFPPYLLTLVLSLSCSLLFPIFLQPLTIPAMQSFTIKFFLEQCIILSFFLFFVASNILRYSATLQSTFTFWIFC